MVSKRTAKMCFINMRYLYVIAFILITGTAAGKQTTCADFNGLGLYNHTELLSSNTWYDVLTSQLTLNECIIYRFAYNATASQLYINLAFKNQSSQMQDLLLYTKVRPNDVGNKPYTIFDGLGHSIIYKFLTIANDHIHMCAYKPSNYTDSFGIILTTTPFPSSQQLNAVYDWYGAKSKDFQTLISVNQSCWRNGGNKFLPSSYWIVCIYVVAIIFKSIK